MEQKRNKIINITAYIASIAIYAIITFILSKLLFKVDKYYLFVIVPMLFLFLCLLVTNFIKIIITIIEMVFGRNDNDEVIDAMDKEIVNTNRFCKYFLIAIFITLLSTITIFDIIFCINKENYNLLAISIIIWLLIYSFLYTKVIKTIKKEIKN